MIPNLVIAGAPKCGSTSLFSYLEGHPSVCAANEQETRFLIDPGYPLYNPNYNFANLGLAGYDQFFTDFNETQHKVLMECTPDYLYQELALTTLSALQPKPHIVFILRKPSRRIYSLYQFAQNNMGSLGQNISFNEFLQMVRSGSIPSEKAILANTLEHSNYAQYLKRWIDAFGKQRITIIIFEELVKDPKGALQPLVTKLGLDAEFYETYSFEQKNISIQVKNQKIFQLVRTLKKMVPNLSTALPILKHLKALYHRFVISKKKRDLSAEERKLLDELDEEFSPLNIELSNLTGSDFSPWNP